MENVSNLYGRLELKKKYKKYFSLAFLISIAIHVILLILYLFTHELIEAQNEKVFTIRIRPYEFSAPPLLKNIEIARPEVTTANEKRPPAVISSNKSTVAVPKNKPGGYGKTGSINKSSGGVPGGKPGQRGGAPLGDGRSGTYDSKLNITENVKDGTGIIPGGKLGNQSWKGEKENKNGKVFGDKDGREGVISGHGTKDGKGQDGPGSGRGSGPGGDGPGYGVTKPSNFSIAWREGGSRTKTSGILPKSPDKLSKPVQIKLLITVAPDGSVSKAVPLQKGDFKLENETIRTIRTWKFEPLKSTVKKIEQTAVVTFSFTLE